MIINKKDGTNKGFVKEIQKKKKIRNKTKFKKSEEYFKENLWSQRN